MNIATIMDAIAAAGEALTSNTYAWPVESASVPCMVVGYPTDLEFDLTFQGGADEANFPVYFLVGKSTDKNARNALSEVIAGATNIKNTLDGNLGGAIQSGRVTDCKIEEVSVAGIPYLSATFTYEVIA